MNTKKLLREEQLVNKSDIHFITPRAQILFFFFSENVLNNCYDRDCTKACKLLDWSEGSCISDRCQCTKTETSKYIEEIIRNDISSNGKYQNKV